MVAGGGKKASWFRVEILRPVENKAEQSVIMWEKAEENAGSVW